MKDFFASTLVKKSFIDRETICYVQKAHIVGDKMSKEGCMGSTRLAKGALRGLKEEDG